MTTLPQLSADPHIKGCTIENVLTIEYVAGGRGAGKRKRGAENRKRGAEKRKKYTLGPLYLSSHSAYQMHGSQCSVIQFLVNLLFFLFDTAYTSLHIHLVETNGLHLSQ